MSQTTRAHTNGKERQTNAKLKQTRPGATKPGPKPPSARKQAGKQPLLSPPPQERQQPSPPGYQALFKQLVQQANQGDRDAIILLRKFLDDNPSIWQRAGDLVAIAESSWIELLAGQDRLMIESVKRRLAAMQEELAGPHPTEMEHLLVQQVTTTWLAMQHAEVQAASSATASLEQAGFRLKKAESAQRRHLTALKTLATLRTLQPRGLAPADSVRLFEPEVRRAIS